MSECLNLTGSSMLSKLGVWCTSKDPEQSQGMETLKASEEFSTVIARFMLFPIFFNISSFYFFFPPLFTTPFLSCKYVLILTASVGNMCSISVSDTVWIKCVAQIWGWRQLVGFCLFCLSSTFSAASLVITPTNISILLLFQFYCNFIIRLYNFVVRVARFSKKLHNATRFK